ncbi:leucyl aminopeptidase [Paenibacillus chartarius]|uniref:Probable cytosol aminopeptidase n=1 Tax=Paenibacillus chartarius TaxID=747481 RepID=A0ABV6DPG2_9BACL
MRVRNEIRFTIVSEAEAGAALAGGETAGRAASALGVAGAGAASVPDERPDEVRAGAGAMRSETGAGAGAERSETGASAGAAFEAAQSEAAALLFVTPEQLREAQPLAEAAELLGAGALAELRRRAASGLFAGELGETAVLATYGAGRAPYVVLSGLGGSAKEPGGAVWRDAAVHAAREALRAKLERLAVRLPADAVQPAAEGIALGHYRMADYKRDAAPRPVIREVAITVPGGSAEAAAAREAVRRAVAIAEGQNYARDLTNLPGNKLTPALMAEEALRLAMEYGFPCQVLDETQILEAGLGGLHEVGKGSVNPPRMIAIRYQGREEWDGDVLGLVGKGITFDTGGISLKKPEGMEEMISDMGGAATLLGLLHIVGELRPKINLLVVIPAAENMPSGGAFKPGDVITIMDGYTVEVLNTDAEGRIVLADGVLYAKKLGATKLIDVATLTGAILVCFADVATGAVTNDDAFLGDVLQASSEAGEKLWQLPNYKEYRDMLKSDVADIKNATTADRWAGAITGGLFVGRFAEDTPWIHLDTGGTAWLWSEKGTEPKGGTGVMVRTLARYILTRE